MGAHIDFLGTSREVPPIQVPPLVAALSSTLKTICSEGLTGLMNERLSGVLNSRMAERVFTTIKKAEDHQFGLTCKKNRLNRM